MASWIIYGSNNVAKATVKELELHDEWMAECYLTISVKSATPIAFAVGDYIDYRGERYTIQYDPNVLKKATSGSYGEGFTYDNIKFVGLQDEVVRCDFNDIVLNDNDIHYTALPTFPFYCESVDDLLDRIQANLEDLYPGQWIIIGLNTVRNSQRGTAVGRAQAFTNAYKQYIDPTGAAHTDPYGKQGVAETADNITCWDAMKKVHDDFDLNFIVRGRVIVVGTAGVFTANTFQYGKGNGLYEIERIGESDQRIVTRLRAYGSEENLPAHYYNTINKQVYATITSILHKFDGNIGADFLLDLDFDRKYFTYRSESYPGTTEAPNYIIEMMANDVTVRGYVTKDATTGKCYVYCESVAGDDDRDEPDASKMAAFVQALTANDRLDFVDYVNKDAFGTGHYDYGTGHLPDNMAVSRLMLPGFPTMSLHAWVQAHKDDADKAWLAQAVADGFTFSTEIYRPYIDSPNKTQYGVRPGSIYFDGSDDTEDVHPTIEGMTYNGAPIDEVYAADQVEDNGVYPEGDGPDNIKITLPVLGFELDKVYEEGASIDMKNGMCGARSFKMAGTPKKDANGRWLCTVERVHDDALDLWFPYCDFQIHGSSEAGRQHGDNYVLTGIDMPDAYIAAASVKLLQVSIEALKKNHAPRYTYQPRIDELWMQRQHDTATASQGVASLHDTLKAGDVFAFADTDLNIDANIIIDVLTIKENGNNGIPTYEVTLRDEKQVGTIQKITNKVDSIVSGAVSINGATGGGLTARQIQSLIDRYGGEQFLSKLNNDTAQGYIKMLQGLQVCNEFAAGPLGYGGVLRKREADGKVELEVDILYARMKAYFDTVEIREYQHTGGNRIASVAGNKICRVAWFNSSNVELEQTQANLASVAYFRCYFRASDGEDTVMNNWVVGDLAYCHVTSITNSSDNPEQKGLNQKHLWRLVIGRNTEDTLTEDGEAYIDLSNRSTETISGTNYTGYQSGSDIPASQDDIIQLGNVNDTTRQGAIVEFVTGTDAPSYQIFQNINSFSLSNKNQIGFGYNTGTGRAYMNVYGDFRFGSRNDSGSYIKYNQQTGALDIKAKVTFTNTQEMSQFVKDNQNNYDDTEVRGLISGLQEQIDGQIETWFYNYSPVNVDASGAPTSNVPLNVAPYSDWTTDNDKIAHLGDTFTNNSTGYCWRFSRNEETNAFEWVIIEDSAVIAALQNAARAQDTADHKRRVFICDSSHQTPTPPYDEGDLWVNVKYPWATGATYDNEILKCIKSVPRTEGGQEIGVFNINDWSLANGYTAKLNNFVNNTYAPFVQNIQGQVDKKAETFRQATDPSTPWYEEDAETHEVITDTRAQHIGDLWMDISENGGNKTYIYQNTGSEETPVYEWKAQEVPDEVFDEIDGKAEIFVTKPTTYNERDMWIIESSTTTCPNADIPDDCKRGDIVFAKNKRTNSYTRGDWEKKDRYTDDSKFNGYISAFLSGSGASGDSATAAAIQRAITTALGSALGSATLFSGGLMLTSLIGMRQLNSGGDPSQISDYTTWGGISGEYNPNDETFSGGAKGHGIAAWYGGDMVDKQMLSDDDIAIGWGVEKQDHTINYRWARSLFRFDGSGYIADANIYWNKEGSMVIKNLQTIYGTQAGASIDINTLSSLSSIFNTETYASGANNELLVKPTKAFSRLYINRTGTPVTDYPSDGSINDYAVLNFSELKARFITKDWFNQFFVAHYKQNNVDKTLSPNEDFPQDATDKTLESVFSFWTNYGLTALGRGVSGSQVVSVLDDLNDVDLGSTLSNNDVLTYDSSTNKWTNKPAQGGSTVAALGDLTDVGISSLADKDILQYDYTNNVWKNVTLATALTGYATQSWVGQQGYALASAIPTNVSQLTNDSGYITSSALSNYLPLSGGTLSGRSSTVLNIRTTSQSNYINLLTYYGTKAQFGYYNGTGIFIQNRTSTWNYPTFSLSDDGLFGFSAKNIWLSNAMLQLMRNDTTTYSDRACIGVTDGNLHIDAYNGKAIYLNDFQNSESSSEYKRVYFNGETYYINKDGYYNGSVSWSNVSGRPTNVSSFINDSGYVTSSGVTSITAGTGLSGGTITSTGTISISQANVSTIINLLEVGVSEAEANDYLVAQYAGGGTSNTTYTRRSVANVVNAARVKAALGTGSGTSKYLREDGTWVNPSIENLTNFGARVYDATVSRSANTVLAAPNGSSGSASFRSLVAADIPTLAISKISNLQTTLDSKLPLAGGTCTGNVGFPNGGAVGGVSYSWGGANDIFTIWSSESSSAAVCITSPHIPFLANGSKGWTGSTVGARIRMQDARGNNWWDNGVDSNSYYYIKHSSYSNKLLMTDSYNYWGGSTGLASWSAGATVIGVDGYRKVVIGQLSGMAIIGAHNSALNAWDVITISGSQINFAINGNSTPSAYLDSLKNFVCTGGVTALSDERDKIVVGEPTITVEQIAQMPTVLYRWNDGREDKSIHAGTLAQRWEPYLPQVVMKAPDERQTRSFAYGVAALIAATIDARKIVDHDRLLREQAAKISELENKCSFLEREVERLKCA